MPPPSYFPLRWESTGEQWWYASPIDWAAANGLYDVVRELLFIDNNLLIKLTSLRRIRRLETVWDDDYSFNDVSKCRSLVARNLFLEGEKKSEKGSIKKNSLIRAGYGGWLLYTAASAGDLGFVMELLERDPLLVFGEGEYGVSDILYAAARSRNCEVFRVLFDLGISSSSDNNGGGGGELGDVGLKFRWEMMNRAVHAAARGGNSEILREILVDSSDVLGYRDLEGSTVLHSAAGRGQLEVVKNLVTSFDYIISSTDNQGNMPLHVAAYKGYLPVVEFLILAAPSLTLLPNKYGDTFLHMAVAGFRTPGFRRLDQQIELVTHLVNGKSTNIHDIINTTNNNGKTALHLALSENVQSKLVELLLTVSSINLNIRDSDGLTPLDLLNQQPRSAALEILIKQLISAGGIFSNTCEDCCYMERNAKMEAILSSPGTSFRIPDGEILLYTDLDRTSREFENFSSDELSSLDSMNSPEQERKKPGSKNYAARSLKLLLQWAQRKDKKKQASQELRLNGSLLGSEMFGMYRGSPLPLRERYLKPQNNHPNKEMMLSKSSLLPSPSTKRKYTAGLMQGVIQAELSCKPYSFSSSCLTDDLKIVSDGEKVPVGKYKEESFDRKLMNRYLCFGAHGLAGEADSFGPKERLQAF